MPFVSLLTLCLDPPLWAAGHSWCLHQTGKGLPAWNHLYCGAETPSHPPFLCWQEWASEWGIEETTYTLIHAVSLLFFFKLKKNFLRFHLFIFREGKGGKKRGKYQCVVASSVPPSGDLAHNPVMCPDWESNWRPFGSQYSAQPTKPHQPGPNFSCYSFIFTPSHP